MPVRIHWTARRATGEPGATPDPERWDAIGFPPPWPDRPWIFGVMVASANNVVAWRRRDEHDDPVRAILGGDQRPERIADRRLMRYLRTIGDVAIGAQTVREQPRLVLTPQEPGDEPAPELYAFRTGRGLPDHPRNIVYSLYGRLPLDHPIFHTPGLDPIVLTMPAGRMVIQHQAGGQSLRLIVEPLLQRDGLRRAHQRLFTECGVRYLGCEGGQTVLRALHDADLLDEVFLTVTDVVVDPAGHDGVLQGFDFEGEEADLIAEGKIDPASGYTFQRWRFHDARR